MKDFKEEVFLALQRLMSRPEKAHPKKVKILNIKCYAYKHYFLFQNLSQFIDTVTVDVV